MEPTPRPQPDDRQELERGRIERDRALRGREDRVAAVSEVLFAVDPIGINVGHNRDEYRTEAQLILLALDDRPPADAESLVPLVHGVFVQMFGVETAGPATRYTESAARIRPLLQGWS
jgi:hypothetical protein